MIRSFLVLTAAFALATDSLPAAEPEAFQLVIKNGAMTQGDGVPDSWTGKFGGIESGRDTQVFKEAPASLRVTAGGGKSGQAFQQIKGGAGAKVRIAGWIKSRGILPRQNEYFSGRIQRIDALIAKLDDGKTVRFLDLGAHFQKTPGKGDVLPELFLEDRLHLSPKGYEVFADALQPLFDEMMKLPPL